MGARDEVMDKQGTQVELTVVGAASLWGIGFGLMAWATIEHGVDVTLGRWSLFIVAVAVTWTLLIGVRCSRRRLQNVLRYELQLLRDDDERERRGRLEVV